jgi:hypothetical protein
MRRPFTTVFCLGALLGYGGLVFGFSPDQFNGVWLPVNPSFRLLTSEGQPPPLKPEAETVYHQHLAARTAGDPTYDPTTWCASPGMPRFQFMRYAFQIVVSPGRIAVLYEWNASYRTIDTRGVALPESFPMALGVASGQWQNGELTVHTAGLSDETLLDDSGLPHSDDLKVTEHWRLRSANVLEDRLTIDDPTDYTRTWDAVVTYRRQSRESVEENPCLDRIRSGEPAVEVSSR